MNPITAMKVSIFFPLIFLSSFLFSQQADTLESKGAIIIASLEGQVTVVNNTTQEPLPASQVKAGGLLVDGHTVKTGPASKVILLLSNGTISTIKSDSSLNIKKFTQAKFDAKGKSLSEMTGEPSASQTVLDLNVGDMILDVKKLDKQSSFNIESPVGTAGIRGTIPYLQVMETEEGGFNQTTSMIEGELAFTPKGSDKPILLGPGDSLTLGILPNGAMIPPTFKTVSMDMINSVNADKALINELTGDNDSGSGQRRSGNIESTDEAEQQEQKNDADAGRSAKSAGADNNGSATLGALADQGIISPTDENALVAVDAINAAGGLFAEKTSDEAGNPNASQRYRRNSDGGKTSDEFVSSLFGNFGDVVEVTAEADELGLKSPEMFDSLLENSENSGAVKDIVAVATEFGVKSKEKLGDLFVSVDKSDDLLVAVTAVKDSDASSSVGMGSIIKLASKGDKLKEGASNPKGLVNAAIILDEVIDSAKADSPDSDGGTTAVFDNFSNFVTVAEVANDQTDDTGASLSGGNLLKGIIEKPESISSMSKVVTLAKGSGASKNLAAVLSKPEQAQEIAQVAEVIFVPGVQQTNAADIFDNIDDVAEAVTEAGSDVANTDFIKNIAKAPQKAKNVVNVVKKAKKAGIADVSLLQNLAANTEQAETMEKVFDELGGENIDPDAAKNLLGNAAEIDVVDKAIGHAKRAGKTGSDLATFAKKDIAEQKAVNEIVDELGDNADSFLTDSFDDALQVKQALDDGVIKATDLSTGKTFAEQFEDNSKLRLAERFGYSVDLESNTVSKDTGPNALQNSNAITFEETYAEISTRAEDVLFALRFVDPGSADEMSLLANIDKLDSIMFLSHKYQDNAKRLNLIYQNLDIVDSVNELVAELNVFQNRLEVVFDNIGLAPAILSRVKSYKTDNDGNPNPNADKLIADLFAVQDIAATLANEELANLVSAYPKYSDQINSNQKKAAEISALIDMLGESYAESVLSNLNQFDNLQTLVFRTKNKANKVDGLFAAISKSADRINDIYSISQNIENLKVPGGQNALFSSLKAFESDPMYYTFSLEHPKLFAQLFDLTEDISRVPSTLAYELEVLDLTKTELVKVLGDLIEGPLSDGPSSSPPDEDNLNNEFSAVSLLESHSFNGEIPSNLVLSETQVFASNLFQETLDTFDALSDLDIDDHSSNEDSADSLSDDLKSGVLGGVNLTFGKGDYDLSKLSYVSLVVASSEDISLSGDISFTSTSSSIEELLFISGASISFAEGTVIDFSGDDLGFGSFNSLEIINVDLHAEDSIGVRSLDSIVIENSKFATRGTGTDEIHMIAAADLTIDNLRFSDQVRQITMEAMTINLSNLNFPNGSIVNLNSAYGGIDGTYPNFGSVATGRVNFIKNVQYNSNLINSQGSFDQHGANISIGVLGK
jgi:hypothetical protein